MPYPYIGEIRLFALPYAPKDWAACNGQTLQISDNPSLYSLIGTQFGGDGRTSFGLPDLRGRVPLGFHSYPQGIIGGLETVSLNVLELAAHRHTFFASSEVADRNSPGVSSHNSFAETSDGELFYATSGTIVALNPDTSSEAGGTASHSNMQPYLALNFCISLAGEYPQRP